MTNYKDLRLDEINNLPDPTIDSDGDKSGHSKADKDKLVAKIDSDATYNYAELLQKISDLESRVIDYKQNVLNYKSAQRICFSSLYTHQQEVDSCEKRMAFYKALSLELFGK